MRVVLPIFLLLVGWTAGYGAVPDSADTSSDTLRVCSDPNNLPFSNRALGGFENRIADLIADELGMELAYTWWPQRRGFIRNTIRAGKCDLVMGVPTSFEMVLVTRPYYRSTYLFLYRANSNLDVRSFDDPILREVKIGVHLIGDDGLNPPPAHALGKRQIVGIVIGYSIYGDYSEPNPPARLVEAVANEEVDVAIVWGPLGGYFAGRQPVALETVPVSPQIDLPFLPMVFDISMGVAREDTLLRDRLDDIIERRKEDIAAILDAYDVPVLSMSRRR